MMRIVNAAVAALALLTCGAAIVPAQSGQKAPARFELRLAESKRAEGLTEATVAGSTTKIYLHKNAALTGAEIADARAVKDTLNKPAVEIVLSGAGAKKLARLSAQHQGKPLALIVDGKVIFAPIVRARLEGKLLVTGNFRIEEAERIANSIKAK